MPINTDNSGTGHAARLRRIAASQGPVPAVRSNIGSQALDSQLGKLECCPCPPCQSTNNLVQNGDFATGTPDTLYVTPPGWVFLESDGNNEIKSSPTPPPPPPATRAISLGNLFSKSYLSQNIPTVIGQCYTLAYDLLDAGNINASSGNWNVNQNLIYFSASVTDVNTPILTPIRYTFPEVDVGFSWRHYTATFTATTTSTKLTFTSSQPPFHFYLTNISVSCTS